VIKEHGTYGLAIAWHYCSTLSDWLWSTCNGSSVGEELYNTINRDSVGEELYNTINRDSV